MCQHAPMPGDQGSRHQLGPLPEELAPEVRRLAECLRSHFEQLGMTIGAYAEQVPWDKGTISRYLSGKLVASKGFVDRLVGDAGKQRPPDETESNKAEAQDLRTKALRTRNAKAAESERIAEELAEAENEIRLFKTRERVLTKELESAESEYRQLLEKYEDLQKSQDPT